MISLQRSSKKIKNRGHRRKSIGQQRAMMMLATSTFSHANNERFGDLFLLNTCELRLFFTCRKTSRESKTDLCFYCSLKVIALKSIGYFFRSRTSRTCRIISIIATFFDKWKIAFSASSG